MHDRHTVDGLRCAECVFSSFMDVAFPGRNLLGVSENIGMHGTVEEMIAVREIY